VLAVKIGVPGGTKVMRVLRGERFGLEEPNLEGGIPACENNINAQSGLAF